MLEADTSPKNASVVPGVVQGMTILKLNLKKSPSKPWKSHAAGNKNQIWNNNWEKCKNLNA